MSGFISPMVMVVALYPVICIAVPHADLAEEEFLVDAVPVLKPLEELEASGADLELRVTAAVVTPTVAFITKTGELEVRSTTTALATPTAARFTGRTTTPPVYTSSLSTATTAASTTGSSANCVLRWVDWYCE